MIIRVNGKPREVVAAGSADSTYSTCSQTGAITPRGMAVAVDGAGDSRGASTRDIELTEGAGWRSLRRCRVVDLHAVTDRSISDADRLVIAGKQFTFAADHGHWRCARAWR